MIRRGAYQYLRKPFEHEDLRRLMIPGIAWRRAHALRHEILGSFDNNVLLQRIHTILSEVLQPDRTQIVLLNSDGVVIGGYPADIAVFQGTAHRFVTHLIGTAQPIFEHAGAGQWNPLTENAKSLIAARVPGRFGRVAGVIVIESAMENAFDPSWVDVLEEIADLTGVALEISAEVDGQLSKLREIPILVNALSHHISTPLQVIKLQAESLRDEILNRLPTGEAGTIAHLEAIERNVDAIAQTRDYLRDVSRDLPVRRKRFDLREMLRACQTDFQPQLDACRISFSFVEPTEHAFPMTGDPALLRYCFQTVLENAVEAIEERYAQGDTDAGSILISIKSPDPAWATVNIQDNGVGIAPENLDKIFGPLFSTKNLAEPRGMGLFTVRRIAARHGGSVAVEQASGSGARFLLTLPRE
jgi:signal transduction histidine kinase